MNGNQPDSGPGLLLGGPLQHPVRRRLRRALGPGFRRRAGAPPQGANPGAARPGRPAERQVQAPPRPPRTRAGRLRAGDAPAGRRPEPRPTALRGPRSYLRPLPPPRPRRGMRHDDPGARSGARPQPAAAARAEDEGDEYLGSDAG
ncbi:translation initiation factor IF-2-like [Mustela erminea]|uniref:translation initiation factor IF-2-like n=1 Tax=Mustela erminea TaxID=36723 RepID=UPI0013876603|nr:translation initiation factor IF-2-like [Mustela erminea]